MRVIQKCSTSLCIMDALIETLNTLNYTPWGRISDIITDLRLGADVKMLINGIERSVDRQMEGIRDMMIARSASYDAVVARYQLAEISPELVEQDHDSDVHLSALYTDESSSPSQEELEYIFPETDADLSISDTISVSCCRQYRDRHTQTKTKYADSDLKEQNRQYLLRGLTWKKKYEDSARRVRDMTASHLREVHHLHDELARLAKLKNT